MKVKGSKKTRYFTFLFLLVSAATLISCAAAMTPEITTPNGIASLEQVELGGEKQWILIRGNDVSKPILLFLHGGPGSCQIPYSYFYKDVLEDHFVVVHWDQRAAGKSFHIVPPSEMKIDNFVSDAHELTLMLLDRFDREKIYVIGKSWGTILGLKLVHRYPDLYYAYVGMGQCVDLPRNEAISYQFVWDEAHKRDNKMAKVTLKMIGAPPYRLTSDVAVQRYWLNKFGGVIWNEKGREARIGPESVEYTFMDRRKKFLGGLYSSAIMWNEILTVNFLEQAPRVELPVYFFTGRHDYNTPFELAEQYYEVLDAPMGKTMVWFDESGHSPCFEEKEKFGEELVRVVEETYPKN